MVLERMQSYITDSRTATQAQKDPSEAMLQTVIKRVPPKDDVQKTQYAVRIGKIFDYIQALVEKSLLKRYEVSS
jgi:hypothetical protein